MSFWQVPGCNEKNHERPQILNQGPFEYEGVLPTRQRRSGLWHKWIKKKTHTHWIFWPGFEASSVWCPWVESPHECLVVFRPVLSTEYLNGNSRRDTGVVKVPAVRRWWRIVRGSHLIPSGDNASTSNRLTHFLPISGVRVVRVERWRAC